MAFALAFATCPGNGGGGDYDDRAWPAMLTVRQTDHYGPFGPNGDGVPSPGRDQHRVHEERDDDMKVWIDQDLCTGDGLCEEIAPAVFTLLDDGLAYVKEADKVKNDPGGSGGMALVPEDLEDAVVEASEECPGECIFIERD
jgi:ferredoxin